MEMELRAFSKAILWHKFVAAATSSLRPQLIQSSYAYSRTRNLDSHDGDKDI